MKRPFRLVGALVVLVALVLFAVREVRNDQQSGKLALHDVVFPYGSAQVGELSLTLGDLKATFRRSGAGWDVVQAPEGADPTKVADFIGAWSRIRQLEIVDEAPRPEGLARFALDKPRLSVVATLRPEAAKEALVPRPSLDLGNNGPLQPSVYARVDGFPRVVLISPDALDLVAGIGRKLLGLPVDEPKDQHPEGMQVGGRPLAPKR